MNYCGMKAEQMEEALEKVMEISAITRPADKFLMRYIRMTAENIEVFTDWDVKYHGLRVGNEYIMVQDDNHHILYAINVSGDSVMQSIAELTDLLAGKGW